MIGAGVGAPLPSLPPSPASPGAMPLGVGMKGVQCARAVAMVNWVSVMVTAVILFCGSGILVSLS